MKKIQVVILAAGQSRRMKSSVAKPLLPLLGKPVLEWILDSVASVSCLENPLVVVGHQSEKIKEVFADRKLTFVEQKQQLGTGDALKRCLEILEKRQTEKVLVLSADVPLISPATLETLVIQQNPCVVVGFEAEDPFGYGRILLNDEEVFADIVEEKDATEEQKEIELVNAGIYVFPFSGLAEKLENLSRDNGQNEYYLTDVPRKFVQEGQAVTVAEIMDAMEVYGFNTPLQYATLVDEARHRILGEHLENGVRIDDPSHTWIETDVNISPGAHIMPFTVIRRHVKIDIACEVGPFAHIRENTLLEAGAEVGNFMEIKNSRLGEGAKAKHLSYIGDADIGAHVNVGAGTVFANYDGREKHETCVEDNVFIGSGTVLVAPVKLGKGSRTGAGAIVTAGHDVAPGETVVGVPARKIDVKTKDLKTKGRS
jgi:bifunctional UDP-N-acetylglucosamine pyrophosphorylase/glucosamine-1-phosphate N-acetyltransferase